VLPPLPEPPKLEPTELNVRESASVVLGFLVALPFLSLPLLLRLIVRFPAACSAHVACGDTRSVGLRVLEGIAGADRVPVAFIQNPILADVGLSLLGITVVLLVCVVFRIPPIGGPPPVFKAAIFARPRTGQSFDFMIRDAGRPHRIAVHAAGRFTGFPGDALIALKLTLAEAKPLAVERHVPPVAEPASARQVTDYVYDPIYFEFTPPLDGPAQLWVGYGSGPEARLRISITRRD
jgi:hypothetical protein